MQQALLGGRWDGDDKQIDAGFLAKRRQLCEIPKLGIASEALGRAFAVAVIKHAENLHFLDLLTLERIDQSLRFRTATDNDRAANQAPCLGEGGNDMADTDPA